jgi:hypothetical protein
LLALELVSSPGVRALAYLGVLAVHVDKVCAARYPDTYGDSRFRTSAAHGDLWKAPFRIVTHGEDYFMGVFLVVSGFLAAFVLFLRSGPLMQQVVASLALSLSPFLASGALRLTPALM